MYPKEVALFQHVNEDTGEVLYFAGINELGVLRPVSRPIFHLKCNAYGVTPQEMIPVPELLNSVQE